MLIQRSSPDEECKDVVSASELNINDVLALVMTKATLAIHVPASRSSVKIMHPPAAQIHRVPTSTASREPQSPCRRYPSIRAQARIHACVVPFSGHVVSLSINHRLQAADAVAWSSAFVGQSKFHQIRDATLTTGELFRGPPLE
jgi:hypothetical protein